MKDKILAFTLTVTSTILTMITLFWAFLKPLNYYGTPEEIWYVGVLYGISIAFLWGCTLFAWLSDS
mgnify:CR=1 FL=1